jgi:hypothetical protein
VVAGPDWLGLKSFGGQMNRPEGRIAIREVIRQQVANARAIE